MSKPIVRHLTVPALILSVVGILGTGPGVAADTSGKIAHFHLAGTLTERPQPDPFGLAAGRTESLKGLLERLAKARKDQSVKAVVLTMEGMPIGTAQIEELRAALAKFKAVDKRVFVHIDGLNMGSLALLSSASDLSLVPTADVWLTGLYAESPYLKGLLDKLGLAADMIHMGAYKAASEITTRTGPSPEAAENMNWLLDGLYDGFVGMIAESRDLGDGQVRRLIDQGHFSAEEAKAAGLVDNVEYRDEFLRRIKKIYGRDVTFDNRFGDDHGVDVDLSNPFAFFSVFTELLSPTKKSTRDSIAIIYVDGTIQTGFEQPSPFGGSSGAFSGDIRKALEKAADDSSIKAVVLRVSSPGGSALASEIIWRATQLVREKKPLIVSMGNVAASGGYYVSCGADMIFADATTITSSIGVVGGKIITTGLWDKIGVNWVPYKRGKNADIMSTSGRFTDEQRQRITDWMRDIYEVFKSRVVKGRGGKLQKPIDDIAAGRVFTGKQGLELGLVDKIGGLADAVDYAARRASISDYELRVIPEPKNILDTLLGELTGEGGKSSDISVQTKPRLFGRNVSALGVILPILERLDPSRTKITLQAIDRLELVHNEGVVTMMPFDFIIR